MTKQETYGEIEFCSRELCERRALACEALAGRHPTSSEYEKYMQWAAEWRAEAKAAS